MSVFIFEIVDGPLLSKINTPTQISGDFLAYNTIWGAVSCRSFLA